MKAFQNNGNKYLLKHLGTPHSIWKCIKQWNKAF